MGPGNRAARDGYRELKCISAVACGKRSGCESVWRQNNVKVRCLSRDCTDAVPRGDGALNVFGYLGKVCEQRAYSLADKSGRICWRSKDIEGDCRQQRGAERCALCYGCAGSWHRCQGRGRNVKGKRQVINRPCCCCRGRE